MERQGGKLFAVSVDPPEQSKRVVAANKLLFSILSDENAELISKLGIVYRGGGPAGIDIANPAQFLFDKKGNLVWQFISRRTQQRVHPDEALRQVRHISPEAEGAAPDTSSR